MPKTVFVNGTVVTPEFLNSLNNPVFVDSPDNDGEIGKILNEYLSLTPGQLLPEWTAFKDELKVSPGTGLSVAYAGGRAWLPDNTSQAIAPGTIVLANNATNYVFVRADGSIGAATTLPLMAFPLAQIVTVGGAISGSVVDLRPRHRVLARQNAIRIFGGNGGQGDYSISTGTAALNEGEYYFRNFEVGEGATVTISQAARIYCSESFTVRGTINVSTVSGSGGALSGVSSNFPGIQTSNNGFGIGGGGRAYGGTAYRPQASQIGSGGSGGFAYSPNTGEGFTAAGGEGGGSLQIEAAGPILIAATGSILAKGTAATSAIISTGTPSLSGGGGGSGGLISLKSITSVRVQGSLDVRGGAGSNALFGAATEGGGGGGGGHVLLISPSNNTTGATISLTGGAGGTPIGGGGFGVPGGGGGGFGGAGGTNNNAGGTGIISIRDFAPIA